MSVGASKSYVDCLKHRWHRIANMVAWDRLYQERSIALRKVIYLDTREALQSIALLKHGYMADNLLAINEKPVEVALLTRRLDAEGLPRVHTRAGLFDEVAWGIGPVDIMDFDGTSNMAGAVGDVLLTNAALGCTPKVLSFAILVGRENAKAINVLNTVRRNHAGFAVPGATSANKLAGEHHWYRLMAVLLNACGHGGGDTSMCLWHVVDWQWGIYRSTSRQTMAWMSARIVPHGRHPGAVALMKRKPSWLRRALEYGLAPSCCLAAVGRMGDDSKGQPRVVTGDDLGCPVWTDEQFRYCGFVGDYARLRALFDAHKPTGWPMSRETVQ